jgi:hypothetical protein
MPFPFSNVLVRVKRTGGNVHFVSNIILEVYPAARPCQFLHGHIIYNHDNINFCVANASLFPGVNSRGELVPSHGASRRRLGD